MGDWEIGRFGDWAIAEKTLPTLSPILDPQSLIPQQSFDKRHRVKLRQVVDLFAGADKTHGDA